jgi:hypothetical protein
VASVTRSNSEDPAVPSHAAVDRRTDLTLEELRTMLAGHGVKISIATLWRFLADQRIKRK